MKNILNYETQTDFIKDYPTNPDAIKTPKPGVAYVRGNQFVKYNIREGISVRNGARELKFIDKQGDGTPFMLTTDLYEELEEKTPAIGTEGDFLSFSLSVDKNLVDYVGDEEIHTTSQNLGAFLPARWRTEERENIYVITFSWGQSNPENGHSPYPIKFKDDVIANGEAVINTSKIWQLFVD